MAESTNTQEILEQTEPNSKKKFRLSDYVPTAAAVCFVAGFIALTLYVIFINIPAFADFFNENVSSIFRFVLAKITYIFPFSVAEAIIFSSPVLAFFLLRAVFNYIDTR